MRGHDVCASAHSMYGCEKMNYLKKVWHFLDKQFLRSLTFVSPASNTKIRYRRLFGRKINLESPMTLNEKIQYMKLKDFEHNTLVRQCADKFEVRKYIKDLGCEEILVPLLAVYNDPEEIDFNALPNAFVIKWNFGCGFNIVCPNKEELDIKKTKEKLRKWGKYKYYLDYAEMQYKGVTPKIIVEKYLKPQDGSLPEDYKVYCFNGKAKYLMLCEGREFGHPKFLYFDRNGKFYPDFSEDGMKMSPEFEFVLPKGYDSIFSYAEKLAAPFPFVRVDFYLVDGKVSFGELTFTSAGGLDTDLKVIPYSYPGNSDGQKDLDRIFGEMVDIRNY